MQKYNLGWQRVCFVRSNNKTNTTNETFCKGSCLKDTLEAFTFSLAL